MPIIPTRELFLEKHIIAGGSPITASLWQDIIDTTYGLVGASTGGGGGSILDFGSVSDILLRNTGDVLSKPDAIYDFTMQTLAYLLSPAEARIVLNSNDQDRDVIFNRISKWIISLDYISHQGAREITAADVDVNNPTSGSRALISSLSLSKYFYNKIQSDARYVHVGGGSGDGIHQRFIATGEETLVGTDNQKALSPKSLYDATYVLKQNQIAFQPITNNQGITGGAALKLKLNNAELDKYSFTDGDNIESFLFLGADSHGNKVEGTIDIFYRTDASSDAQYAVYVRENHGSLHVRYNNTDPLGVNPGGLILIIGTEDEIGDAGYRGNLELRYLSGIERANVIDLSRSEIENTSNAIQTSFNGIFGAITTRIAPFESDFVVIDESKPTHLIGKTDGIIFTNLITYARVQRHGGGNLEINFSLPVDLKVDDYITKLLLPTELRRGYIQINRIRISDENKETFSVTLKWTAYAVLNGFGGSAGAILGEDEVTRHFPLDSDFVISKATPGKSQQEVKVEVSIDPLSNATATERRNGTRDIVTYVSDIKYGNPTVLNTHKESLHPGGITADNLSTSFPHHRRIQPFSLQLSTLKGGFPTSRSSFVIGSNGRNGWYPQRIFSTISLQFNFNTSNGFAPSAGTLDAITYESAYYVSFFAGSQIYNFYIVVVSISNTVAIFTTNGTEAHTDTWTQKWRRVTEGVPISNTDFTIDNHFAAGGGPIVQPSTFKPLNSKFVGYPILAKIADITTPSAKEIAYDYVYANKTARRDYAFVIANGILFGLKTTSSFLNSITNEKALEDLNNFGPQTIISGSRAISESDPPSLYIGSGIASIEGQVEEIMYRSEAARLNFHSTPTFNDGTITKLADTITA